MKAKRFTYQQIRKQEKPIESEDSPSSYEGKRLVGEKEINETHQVGNLLLKITKEEETIFNLSEQLRSFLIQYEVLNDELDQLKTLLVANKHITREQIQLQSLQPSSQVVSMQIENPEYQQPLPQVYQQQFASTQEDKNKGISERLERKNPYQEIKKASSQKKMLTLQIKLALNQKLQRFKNLKVREEKKDVKPDLKTLNNKRRNLQEKIFQCQNQERASWLTFLTKKVVEPCHVKLNGQHQSG